MSKRREPEPEVEASSGSMSNEWSSEEAPVIEVDVPGEATYWLPMKLVNKRSASFLASCLKQKVRAFFVQRPTMPLPSLKDKQVLGLGVSKALSSMACFRRGRGSTDSWLPIAGHCRRRLASQKSEDYRARAI